MKGTESCQVSYCPVAVSTYYISAQQTSALDAYFLCNVRPWFKSGVSPWVQQPLLIQWCLCIKTTEVATVLWKLWCRSKRRLSRGIKVKNFLTSSERFGIIDYVRWKISAPSLFDMFELLCNDNNLDWTIYCKYLQLQYLILESGIV